MATKQPNILILWGDDIGWYNISAYNHGVMGYRTPNIDRMATGRRDVHRLVRPAELYRGTRRLHHRAVADPHGADQGRAAGRRSGPASQGPDDRRPAQAARLCHRPVRQEPPRRQERVPAHGPRVRRVLRQPVPPERRGGAGEPRLPEEPRFQEALRAARRHALWATEKDDPTEDPTFGRVGKQRIENTGPLTTKRMETVDDEFTDAALAFIDKAHNDGKPFFVWCELDPHAHLHSPQAGVDRQDWPGHVSRRHGRARRRRRPAARRSSTSWASPTTPSSCTRPTTAPRSSPGPTAARRRSAARRTPTGRRAGACRCMIRWPGVIKPGTVSNEIFAHEDMMPTLLAAAGVPDVEAEAAHRVRGRRQDVQGPPRRLQPAAPTSRARSKESPRKEMLYWSDDGDLMALRYEQLEGRLQGAARGELPGLVGADGRTARAEALQPAQ